MSENQRPKPYVLFHDPCPDGFTAAYAMWRHFGDEARYVGVSHGNPPPSMREGADLYMVDFSYKREVLLELAKQHPRVVIIDHHAPAMKELEGIQEEADNVEVIFDNERSGATLVWEHLSYLEGSPLYGMRQPLLFKYIEDRDLWKFEEPDSKEISAALFSYDFDFELWDEFARDDERILTDLVKEGAAILRMQDTRVAALVEEARIAQVAGQWVPAVNAPYFLASDLGHALLERFPKAPFAGVYRDTGNGRRDWSLRSTDDRTDVNEVAKSLGGGGHRNASGCSEPATRQVNVITFVLGKTYVEYEQEQIAEQDAYLEQAREEGVI